MRAIDAVRIQRLRRGLAATPNYANAVLRLLLAYATMGGLAFQRRIDSEQARVVSPQSSDAGPVKGGGR